MAKADHHIPRWSLFLVALLILLFVALVSSSLFNVSEWYEPDLTFFQNSSAALSQANLSVYQGPVPTLVMFWKFDCQPCKVNMAFLNQFNKKLKVIGVHVGSPLSGEDTREARLIWANSIGKGARLYFDETGLLEQSFEIRGTPSSFLIFPKQRKMFSLDGLLEKAKPSLAELVVKASL